jgi:cytochrome P450
METYDPRRPEIQADPYPALAELRARNPFAWNSVLRGWVVTRYRDVRDLLLDRRFSSNRITPFMEALPPARRVALSGLERVLTRWAVLADPPAHARLRAALVQVFSPDAVAALRPRVQSVAATLLDRAARGGGLDFIAAFAAPLASEVMSDLLGLPAPDLRRFAAWSDDVFLSATQVPANKYDRAAYRLAEMEAQFRALVRARRTTASRGDLVDGLVAADLDDDEIVASLILILLAGHQTTVDLIGNGLWALLRHPGELARLRANPGLIGSAVEELLRFESPTACVSRVASTAIELGGRRIARGDTMFLMLNAANRDAAQFAEPDRLDIGRADNRHLAFGHGMHDCLGAPLARLHAQGALPPLLERFADIDLVDARAVWRDGFAQRGLMALRLRVRPAS